MPYVLALADNAPKVLRKDLGLRKGLNIVDGNVTHHRVAEAVGMGY
jgi:alanine dehydrogenase